MRVGLGSASTWLAVAAASGGALSSVGCADERATAADSMSDGGSGGSGGAAGGGATSDGGTGGGSTGGAGGSSGGAGGSAGDSGGSAGTAGNDGGGGGATSAGGTGGGSTGGTSGEGGEGGSAGADQGFEVADCRPDRACAGYTLIGSPENDAGAEFDAFLVDMQGNVVHRWTLTGFPPKMLPGGALIGCTGVFRTSYDCVEMQQRSWDDRLEWSFADWESSAARHHHDLQREGNPVGYYAPGQPFVEQGNTLILAHDRKSVPEIREGIIDDDVIYEVNFGGELTGFEWHAADHLDAFGFDTTALDDIATRNPNVTIFEWLHGNTLSLVGDNHWFDEGHAEFHPDNIIYSSRNATLVLIISRESGEVVWRLGPDFSQEPGATLGPIGGQHHPHLIPTGLPGEGNMLIFDNGGGSGYGNARVMPRGWSRVLEFDPISLELVWQYGSESGPEHFFSGILSSAQRLPNGNTLITDGVNGRAFEVTPDKQTVWEYQHVGLGPGQASWVYRAVRVPPEWLPAGINEAQGDYASWAAQFEQ